MAADAFSSDCSPCSPLACTGISWPVSCWLACMCITGFRIDAFVPCFRAERDACKQTHALGSHSVQRKVIHMATHGTDDASSARIAAGSIRSPGRSLASITGPQQRLDHVGLRVGKGSATIVLQQGTGHNTRVWANTGASLQSIARWAHRRTQVRITRRQ